MKPRDRLILGVLALGAVVAAMWIGVLAPKREEAAGMRAKVTKAEQRRDEANTKVAEGERARASYPRDAATIARLGKATPPQADVASLVYQLEVAARVAGVDFRSVSMQDEPTAAPDPDGAAASKTPSGITAVPFSFGFEGNFFKLHKLLRSVDRFSHLDGQTVKINGRLLTLDSVALTAGRNGFPQVKVAISAHAYVAPIPDQIPSAAKTAPGADPATTTAEVGK
jgi:hypothetical protein